MRRSLLIDIATSSRLDLSPEELAEVERQFSVLADRHRRTRRTIVVCVVAGLIGAAIALAVAIGLRGRVPLGPPWSTVVTIGIAGVAPLACVVVAGLLFLRATRGDVRRALRACGHDVCEGCGYRLGGVPAGHACPECGRGEQTQLGDPPGDASH
jgi:hypothetical protein